MRDSPSLVVWPLALLALVLGLGLWVVLHASDMESDGAKVRNCDCCIERRAGATNLTRPTCTQQCKLGRYAAILPYRVE